MQFAIIILKNIMQSKLISARIENCRAFYFGYLQTRLGVCLKNKTTKTIKTTKTSLVVKSEIGNLVELKWSTGYCQ